jgi:hypothetical protein
VHRNEQRCADVSRGASHFTEGVHVLMCVFRGLHCLDEMVFAMRSISVWWWFLG